MTFLKVLGLMIIFLLKPMPVQSVIHYIGLGRDCQVTGALIHFNLRAAAYPLDWMVSLHFDGVIHAFQTDFKQFLNPSFLVYQTHYIENTYYQFGYNHFFPLVGHPITDEVHVAGTVVPNFLDYLPHVKEVQNRRIKRLLNLLSSQDNIVFIRTHSTPHEAADFMNMIKYRYPKKKIFLVVVHEREDLIGEWFLPNVLNFYASQRTGFADWWTMDEWAKILAGIQFWLFFQGIL